jgi:hypothetical protein
VNGRNDKTETLITIEKTKEPFEQQLQCYTCFSHVENTKENIKSRSF